jgi:hypothetical protein
MPPISRERLAKFAIFLLTTFQEHMAGRRRILTNCVVVSFTLFLEAPERRLFGDK